MHTVTTQLITRACRDTAGLAEDITQRIVVAAEFLGDKFALLVDALPDPFTAEVVKSTVQELANAIVAKTVASDAEFNPSGCYVVIADALSRTLPKPTNANIEFVGSLAYPDGVMSTAQMSVKDDLVTPDGSYGFKASKLDQLWHWIALHCIVHGLKLSKVQFETANAATIKVGASSGWLKIGTGKMNIGVFTFEPDIMLSEGAWAEFQKVQGYEAPKTVRFDVPYLCAGANTKMLKLDAVPEFLNLVQKVKELAEKITALEEWKAKHDANPFGFFTGGGQ